MRDIGEIMLNSLWSSCTEIIKVNTDGNSRNRVRVCRHSKGASARMKKSGTAEEVIDKEFQLFRLFYVVKRIAKETKELFVILKIGFSRKSLFNRKKGMFENENQFFNTCLP